MAVTCHGLPARWYPTSSGSYLITQGGPGSANFVPNNIEPVNSSNAALYQQARYYDVTLKQAGRTTLAAGATIDALTVNGLAMLNITDTGNLKRRGPALPGLINRTPSRNSILGR